ncbi:NUDIX domain-containing protein [Paludibacterium paludis]|uniref:Nudix hydrolase domain-containing protein n=1 Tax=Paludibacterium paludis TaxID=1225769 RepID=A0A918UBS7_9NEIS|nr:NUDIX domain-containing protein [Paludibacterium paludis]GGY26690.1 hypothetical protein GCM10011289_32820 [Paludibacterium paludis]
MLTVQHDSHGGVTIQAGTLMISAVDFARELSDSLAEWEREGVRTVWLEVDAGQSRLIPVALCLGFSFRHCRPDRLTLARNLVEGSGLPEAATHTVSVVSVVLNGDGEVLTVPEHGDAGDLPGHFRLPGGTLAQGELLAQSAVRHVFETTDVRADFVGLIGLRHQPGEGGPPRLCAVCLLHPLDAGIRSDRTRIAAARWVAADACLAREDTDHSLRSVLGAALAGRPLSPVTVAPDGERDEECYLPRLQG